MNAEMKGLLWCFTFVILEAAQAVFFGGVFQRLDAFLIGSLVFGLTTLAALSWTGVRDPGQLAAAFGNRGALTGMNVSAAGGWLSYFIAIQLVEPAVAFAIFSGTVPLATLVAARLGVAEASPARNRPEVWGYCIVSLGLLVLVAGTLTGNSGFVRGGLPIAAAGLALSALSGAFIAAMLFYCHRLHRAGVGPVAQLGLRFLLYILLAIGCSALGLDAKEDVPASDLIFAVLIGLAIISFPTYAMQKAVSLVSSLTVGAITALGPLFVFAFQIVEGRVAYADVTMLGLTIYFVGAVVASMGATKAVRSPLRQNLTTPAIGASHPSISAMVDREISRLALDEFRSRG